MDCIYEGGRALYIHPDECVDCGACEPVCPVEAIYYEDDLPEDLKPHLADNEAFFAEPLPGRDAPLGSPGGRPSWARSASTPRWWQASPVPPIRTAPDRRGAWGTR
ncbi:ferredoxin [Mycobacterium avium subsp. avium 2285 (R)]|nr:ferredoxin [Mycobacterium avium subsp. avium 2285 (R)]